MSDKIPSAVGTNRTYWQTIKENAKDSWDKIKSNTFVNMVLPLEELSEGHTEAALPYVVPGGGAAARTVKGVSKIAKKVTPAELARLTEEESAIAENVMQPYKVPGYDPDLSQELLTRRLYDPSPRNRSRYADDLDDYTRELYRIQRNYENAMTRRRDYTYPYVGYAVTNEGSPVFIGPDKKSMLIAAGQNSAKPGELKMITHFAPETLRGGVETVKEALYAPDPIGFAVTDDLAPMLEKIGYIKVGNVPQYFAGEVVNKTVFVNRATTEKAANDWLLKHHYTDEPIKIEALQYNISDDSPKLHTYPIKDLIQNPEIKRHGGSLNYLNYIQ